MLSCARTSCTHETQACTVEWMLFIEARLRRVRRAEGLFLGGFRFWHTSINVWFRGMEEEPLFPVQRLGLSESFSTTDGLEVETIIRIVGIRSMVLCYLY